MTAEPARTARTAPTFWLDSDHDLDQASDGRSRYGSYVRKNAADFSLISTAAPTVDFAATAWRLANGPVMSPPLVRRHRRIICATLERNEFDGALCATVEMVAVLPACLARLRPADGGFFRGWYGSAADGFQGPSGEDVARGAHLRATVLLDVAVPAGRLPVVEFVPGGQILVYQAIVVVEQLAVVLSELVGPVVAALDAADRSRGAQSRR